MKEPALYKKFQGCERLPELLLRCTDATSDTESRYHLALPWLADGYVYATDGRIAARMLATGLPKPLVKFLSDRKERRVPKAATVFTDNYVKQTVKLPDLPDPRCKCPKCGHVHADDRSVTEFVQVGPVRLAFSYILMLRRYNVERIWVPKKSKTAEPIKFEINGVEGRLMPSTGC